jgi:hypothetical protein
MASKYQTPTAMDTGVAAANFRVSKFTNDELESLTIRPNYQLTLTPYSYIYLNVFYNSGTPISVRAMPNVPTVVPYISASADIINVGSAASIRDFGDLAPLYADTISVQNATRIKNLKIGDRTAGYENKGFSSLTTGSNGLLEELDISNIVSFSTPLDLTNLINLKKLWASGTNIPSIAFANGGKIDYAELPAVNDINLKGLRYLSTANFKIARNQENQIASVVDLAIENCPLIDQFSIFSACPNLNRVKLDNINFGTQTYEYFVNNIFKLKGLDDDHPNAQLTGAVYIEELTGEQFNELKLRYPNLKVTYTNLQSQLIFMQVDNETEYTAARQAISNGRDGIDPIQAGYIDTPAKEPTAEFNYEFIGWSTAKDTTIADELALKHVEGDRTLYPVFKQTRRNYTVTFINATEPVGSYYYSCTVETPYGATAKCPWSNAEIRKMDVADPDAYIFNGWSNDEKPTNANVFITGNTICYALFTYASEATLTLWDITGDGLINQYGQIIESGKGYTIKANNTMDIIACRPSLNASIIIPEELIIDSVTYTITGLGGFHNDNERYNHNRLAHIKIADTVITLLSEAFEGCANLSNVELSRSIKELGRFCFESCISLENLYLPASLNNIREGAFLNCTKLKNFDTSDNAKYNMLNGCLVSDNKTVVFGIISPEVAIPTASEITNLQSYCFSGNNYLNEDIVIPENIIDVGANAFQSCHSIKTLTFTNPNTVIGATCFDSCSSLTRVTLPANLTKLNSWTFQGCHNLLEIELPASIINLGTCVFGGEKQTFKVTFAEGTNLADLTINKDTFGTSLTGQCQNVTLECPWTQEEHIAKFGSLSETWGAKNIVFNFKGGNN